MQYTISNPMQLIELFTLKTESKKTVDEIAQNMPAACDSFNFSLLKEYNYHEIVESKGFPISRKVYVFEICRAKIASEILTVNPDFSIFMPCKISVYEQEDHTVISTMNMDLLIKVFQDDTEMYQEVSAIFNSIKQMINTIK
jgi:uncharacterized protein (DUF302 family)